MKKLLSFFIVSISFFGAFAEEVSVERARQYVKDKVIPVINPVAEIGELTPIYHNDCLVYYICNLQPEGWALVSATDAVTPLLGYNPTGRYELRPEMDNVNAWMNGYAKEIKKAVDEKDKPIKEWAKMDDGSIATRASGSRVDPLITVNWNQGNPYNKYCPSDANGRAVVGCVAVAMAQAMSVAQYPKRPTGEFSYTHGTYGTLYINYDEEPAYDWSAIISGANAKDDVAKLLYHCGVSVRMDYSPDGSGTQSSYVPGALKRNFAYPDATTFHSRESYEGDWEQLVIDELEAGRVVYYSGYDPNKGYGHAFNLDGYDGNSMYHVNWGWGGANNGYFTINGLRDQKMGMDYTAGHGAVVGIRAPSAAPTDIVLSATEVPGGVEAGFVVGNIEVVCEVAGSMYNYKITGPYNYLTKKYNTVPFNINFAGDLVTTEVLTVGKEYKTLITATDFSTKASFTKEFVIKVVDGSAVDRIEMIERFSFDGQTLSVSSKGDGMVTIYSLQGVALAHSALLRGTNSIQLNIPNGIYMMKTEIGGDTSVRKIQLK